MDGHQPRARSPPTEPFLYTVVPKASLPIRLPWSSEKSLDQATPETLSIRIVLVGTWEVPRAAKLEDQCLRPCEIHGSFMTAAFGGQEA